MVNLKHLEKRVANLEKELAALKSTHSSDIEGVSQHKTSKHHKSSKHKGA